MSAPKVLILDIETGPAHALVFGQWNQNIGNIQIIQPDRIIGIGAKWHHKPAVMWKSEYHHSRSEMIEWIRDLFNEADVVVHFNGATFDMPWIRREIVQAGLLPHSPVQEVDLLKVVKKQFRFMSNKLENVVQMLGVGEKMKTGGFGLWRDIEVGTAAEQRAAWKLMRDYCKQDVKVEGDLYEFLLPWIPNHPHVGLFSGEDCCSNCGSLDLVRRGFAYTTVGKYQRFLCTSCGRWGRSARRVSGVDVRGVA